MAVTGEYLKAGLGMSFVVVVAVTDYCECPHTCQFVLIPSERQQFHAALSQGVWYVGVFPFLFGTC